MYVTDGLFMFASELKSFIAHPDFIKEIDGGVEIITKANRESESILLMDRMESTSLDEISDAIDFVLDGETWLPPGINLSSESPSEEKEIAQKLSKLTPAQYRVLQMIADGLLNKQIAYEMNIQEPTVKNHVSAILQKFEVNNRTQASSLFQKLKQNTFEASNLI